MPENNDSGAPDPSTDPQDDSTQEGIQEEAELIRSRIAAIRAGSSAEGRLKRLSVP